MCLLDVTEGGNHIHVEDLAHGVEVRFHERTEDGVDSGVVDQNVE
jgi:hypothetical protein